MIRDNGHFLDLRHDVRYPGHYRFHGGVDYIDKPGEKIYSIVTGTVTKTFCPSEQGLIAIEVKTDQGYIAQTLYISPTPALLAALARHEHPIIHAGDAIGTAQDIHMLVRDRNTGKLRPAYDPKTVPQHVHITLKDSQGRFVSPNGHEVLIMKKGNVPIKLTGQ